METNPVDQNQENVPQSANGQQAKKHGFAFILTSFTIASSDHFSKAHKRKFNSFGCIHEFGKLSGSML